MKIEQLIALLEQAKRLNGNCEVLVKVSFNNISLTNGVKEITYGKAQIIIS